jgi:carboxylesterase
MTILKGAEPFLLRGDERGVLLIHGFTGSPSEMRLLGDFLHGLGYTVLAPRLCGHGTSPEEMAGTAWRNWYTEVENGYYYLQGLCRQISVIGLSMGGLLALKLASEYSLDHLVVMSTPLYLADRRLPLLPLYRLFRRFMPKRRRKLYSAGSQYSIAYDRTPLSSLSSLLKLIEQVKLQLPAITAPLLVIQSRNEHTVLPKSAQYLYDQAGSCRKELLWLQKSGHIITLDVERDQVFARIAAYLVPNL